MCRTHLDGGNKEEVPNTGVLGKGALPPPTERLLSPVGNRCQLRNVPSTTGGDSSHSHPPPSFLQGFKEIKCSLVNRPTCPCTSAALHVFHELAQSPLPGREEGDEGTAREKEARQLGDRGEIKEQKRSRHHTESGPARSTRFVLQFNLVK